MKLIIVFLAILVVAHSLVDHDGWEFYGGQKKRRAHGLNRATKDHAPRTAYGGIDFGEQLEEMSDIVVTNDEAPPAPKVGSSLAKSDRKWSSARIKSKEELLLLSAGHSVLDFYHDEYIDGVTAESDVVSDSWWGRLYIEGFPMSMQYFRAHFGVPPPPGNVRLRLASPPNMCDELAGVSILENSEEYDWNTFVVSIRGGCTFGEKAIAALDAGAAGILFVNNIDGIDHPSAPEIYQPANISANMIGKDAGAHLIKALEEARDEILLGRFVSIVCKTSVTDKSYCEEARAADKNFVSSLEYMAKMELDGGEEFDFLAAEFGSWANPSMNYTIQVPSVIGGDAHCCERDGFEGNNISQIHAIVCLRGECDFATKAENAQLAGAGMMIVGSHNITLQRMGADPPRRGMRVMTANAMVSFDAYEAMVDSFYSKLDEGMPSKITYYYSKTQLKYCSQAN